MHTPQQQKQFFDTFGFLVLPGLLSSEIGWITEEFEAVFTDRGIQHDATKRSIVVPFIDQREKLCSLLDHPSIVDIASNLLGPDFNYLGGDGNYYTGDTSWHSDGFHDVGLFLKVALYLDPVARDTGCLRVIPASQRVETRGAWAKGHPAQAESLWGIAERDVPCLPLESKPGDVVIFNHNLLHAAFGGGTRRRMFTLNLCRRCDTPEEIQDLKSYIGGHDRMWIDSLHSDIMRRTASPERQKHLRQVAENEGHLPELSAQARARMAEAARG